MSDESRTKLFGAYNHEKRTHVQVEGCEGLEQIPGYLNK